MESSGQYGRVAGDGPKAGESGFMLLAAVIMVAIVLIALAVAAPVVAKQLRRDREVESIHRAQQYVRAIQLYQRKFPNQYPPSIKALEGSNNIRYLRHQYVDPLTGNSDWRLIHQGEQRTKIHVFFGEELAGLAAGLGSAAGMQSGGTPGTAGTSSTSTIGASTALGAGFTGASITSSTTGTSGSTGSTGTTGATGSTGGMFGDSTGGVIVGVGPAKGGESISQPNGQTSYDQWEFWYDPRIELLKKAVNVTGGGISSGAASSFGQDAVSGQPNGATGSTGATGATGSTGAFGSKPF